jgi:hypothetical protein
LAGAAPWILILAGNHDLWTKGRNPIKWLASDVPQYDWAAKIELSFPNGCKVRIDARHDHPGNSIWNELHGQRRAAVLAGGAHLYIAGHKHNWACGQIEDYSRNQCVWLARARGYLDRGLFALQAGYEPQRWGQSITSIIDPNCEDSGRIHLFADVQSAADYLTYTRSKM